MSKDSNCPDIDGEPKQAGHAVHGDQNAAGKIGVDIVIETEKSDLEQEDISDAKVVNRRAGW